MTLIILRFLKAEELGLSYKGGKKVLMEHYVFNVQVVI